MTIPTSANAPDTQARIAMPVMMVADASTIPIWKAADLVQPIKQRIKEVLRGGGDGWSSRTLRLIQRFRKSVHQAR